MWRHCSLLFAIVACKQPAPIDSDPIDTDTDVQPQDTGPFVPTLPPPPPPGDPCDDFALVAPTSLGPGQTAFLAVTGGIGPWTYSLAEDNSGGAINAGSGEWLAGPVQATDVVAAYDAGCDLEDSASVVIYAPITAQPDGAVVPPGQSFAITATGGSGGWSCDAISLEAGATLSGCDFVAGAVGLNRVQVTDSQTGLTDETEIVVAEGVELLSESVHLVAVGFPYRPEPIGGSGRFDIVPIAGLSVVDDALTATAPGSYSVTAIDPATGISQPITVVASEALTVDPAGLSRDGEFLDLGEIRFADLDGDGFDELILSTLDRAVAARQGGAVLIYPGTVDGFEDLPTQVFGSDQPNSRGGRGLAVADFDADGQLDIAVGEYLWDRGSKISLGRVSIYPGVAGGFVDVGAMWALEGTDAYDQIGFSVLSCDVNGDGVADLITGGPGLDDDSVSPTVSATGGVQVYFGGSGGLSETPDRRWYAQRPSTDGTGWADARLAEAGTSLAAGDLDGDGLCDIAVGGSYGDAVSDGFSRGGVWLLRDEELMNAPGPPYRVIGVSDDTSPNIDFGTRVELVPAAGSEFDAVVVSARYASNGAGDSRAGAVFAYRSQSLRDGGPATQLVEYSDWDWSFEGATSNDWVGHGLAVAPDGSLRIGGSRSAPLSGGGDMGVVFEVGVDFGLSAPVSSLDVPQVDGFESGSYFGSVVGVAPDSGSLVVLASRQNHPDVVPPGRTDGALFVDGVELDMPTPVVGGSVGTSVAWFDVDGGGADVLAGATGIALEIGSDSGAMGLWSGGTGAGVLRAQIDEQDRDEALGSRMIDVGDLNGDGFDDLAVVGASHSYSAPLPATYAVGSCPAVTRYAAGAVYVWLGSAVGVGDQPDFAVFGEVSSARLNAVTTAFDFDGDGQQGLAVSSSREETVWVYDGPWVPTPGVIVERCDPESSIVGPGSSSFGNRIAAVPSLDGDGCDELAVSASEDDVAGSSRGALRVFRGCAGTGATWKTWTTDTNGQRMGGGGLGVGDVNNDGVVDLVVGSVALDLSGIPDAGAAWFIDGASLAPVVWENTDGDGDLVGLLSEVSVVPAARLTGTVEAEQLGADIAIVGSGADALVLLGRPGAADASGGVDGWRMTTDFDRRMLRMGPEGRYSGLGTALMSTPESMVVVGAPNSDVAGIGGGAVYRFSLP